MSDLAAKWSGPRVLRSELNPYVDPGIDFSDDAGFCDQSQADECDVNRIIDRFHKTGVLPGVDREGVYGDFSDPVDYHAAMNTVLAAEQQFNGLDAKIRRRFENDPAKFLAFANDPRSAEEMVEMGLATRLLDKDGNVVIKAGKAIVAPSASSPSSADPSKPGPSGSAGG